MGHEPENTLRSVVKAMALGAPCVEIDVHLVGQQVVVIHDSQLERTTNGHGLLTDHSYLELRTLDAGCGEKIPTLSEVCAAVHPSTCLNIELKGPGTAAPVAAQIELLIRSGWRYEALLVSSFDHNELAAIRRLNEHILVGVLLDHQADTMRQQCDHLAAYSVHARFQEIDAAFVKYWHERGQKIFAYTVNDADDLGRMHELGVDGVFTNFPEKVVENYDQGPSVTSWIERTSV
ncbi:MAG: glycerophosphoryl diester phosphodiesterase [Candidatus Krumholzibacteriia bacterium]|jgi:glycerophosphoryl diester phosphodiesterase